MLIGIVSSVFVFVSARQIFIKYRPLIRVVCLYILQLGMSVKIICCSYKTNKMDMMLS